MAMKGQKQRRLTDSRKGGRLARIRNDALASWSATALCRFGTPSHIESGRGLPQSKTSRDQERPVGLEPIRDFRSGSLHDELVIHLFPGKSGALAGGTPAMSSDKSDSVSSRWVRASISASRNSNRDRSASSRLKKSVLPEDTLNARFPATAAPWESTVRAAVRGYG